MRIALLSNVKSGRNKKGVEAIEAQFKGAGALLLRFDGTTPLRDLCGQIMQQEIDLLALSSGDGMIQGFWTALLDYPHQRWPIMALLPRGTTNMTHADLGLTSSEADEIERLIALAATSDIYNHLMHRSAVRVDNIEGGPQCGAFFGAAAVVDAIKICKKRFHAQGMRGDLAHGLTVLRMLTEMLLGRGKITKRGGAKARILVDGDQFDEPVTLFVATTLEKLLFNSDPFWGEGEKPLKASWIDFPAPKFVRACLKLMAGMDLSTMPKEQYHSVKTDRITLDLDEPIVLDGEFYHASHGKPYLLSTTHEARFVRFRDR